MYIHFGYVPVGMRTQAVGATKEKRIERDS